MNELETLAASMRRADAELEAIGASDWPAASTAAARKRVAPAPMTAEQREVAGTLAGWAAKAKAKLAPSGQPTPAERRRLRLDLAGLAGGVVLGALVPRWLTIGGTIGYAAVRLWRGR